MLVLGRSRTRYVEIILLLQGQWDGPQIDQFLPSQLFHPQAEEEALRRDEPTKLGDRGGCGHCEAVGKRR